jgi:hypothetical protein
MLPNRKKQNGRGWFITRLYHLLEYPGIQYKILVKDPALNFLKTSPVWIPL